MRNNHIRILTIICFERVFVNWIMTLYFVVTVTKMLFDYNYYLLGIRMWASVAFHQTVNTGKAIMMKSMNMGKKLNHF